MADPTTISCANAEAAIAAGAAFGCKSTREREEALRYAQSIIAENQKLKERQKR